MKTKSLICFAALLYFSGSASAQPRFVTLANGGSVPCDHPLAISEGKGCLAGEVLPSVVAGVIQTDITSVTDCRGNFDPYTNAEAALQCWKDKFPGGVTDDGWRFKIGKTYLHPYFSLSVTILGLVVDIQGNPVFVAETNTGSLHKFSSGDNPRGHGYYKEQ